MKTLLLITLLTLSGCETNPLKDISGIFLDATIVTIPINLSLGITRHGEEDEEIEDEEESIPSL